MVRSSTSVNLDMRSNPSTAYVTTIIFYGTLEAGLCIIAACLPTLGSLFSREGRDRLRSSTSRYKASKPPRVSHTHNPYGFPPGKDRNTAIATSLSDTSQINFVPREPNEEFIRMDTFAVGSLPSETVDHHEDEGRITVTTDIDYTSAKIDLKG
ncbi:hypothetical protein MMC14_003157 [Varicellaria rhodocarpa]|nr:hypothetical protein [Varicellaria rhodocarpa]